MEKFREKTWGIDFLIEPRGREVSIDIEAESSREAMIEALTMLELEPDELLHTIHAHIGRPSRSGT